MDQETTDRLLLKLSDYQQRVAKLQSILNLEPSQPLTQVVVSECWFCRLKVWVKALFS